MPFEATHAEYLTGTVYGDTFNLIIVDDIWFCGLIGVGIGLSLVSCTCAGNHGDNFEITVSGCASFDVEACTVEKNISPSITKFRFQHASC